MSRFATSIPLDRRVSSSTIHSAKPIALCTVIPWSAMRFARSFREPPLSTYSWTLLTHGSIAW
jgi:hypothetical protein